MMKYALLKINTMDQRIPVIFLNLNFGIAFSSHKKYAYLIFKNANIFKRKFSRSDTFFDNDTFFYLWRNIHTHAQCIL